MCWITSKKPKLKTANKIIKVYKIFRGSFEKFSPLLYPYHWIPGEIRHQKIGKVISEKKLSRTRYRINEGFHSFICLPKIEPININESYIETTYSFIAFENKEIIVCECEIPKGSLYYINKCGEIVSNKLKIIECVKS